MNIGSNTAVSYTVFPFARYFGGDFRRIKAPGAV